MHLKFLASVLVIVSGLLTACETLTVSRQVTVNTTEKWALLPIKNLSKTPLAGNRARAIVETHLRAQGINNLELYEAGAEQSLLAQLDDARQLEESKAWAIENGIRYGVTGNVQEWQYKNGLDNEPSVGLTLKFIDMNSDEVLWVATASRTGWGYSNLSSVASKAIDDLLSEVRFRQLRGSNSSGAIAQAKPAAGNKPRELPSLPANTSAANSATDTTVSAAPPLGAALPAQGNVVTLTSGVPPVSTHRMHKENISR